MAKRDLIVIGASAGGVEALKAVVAGLPAGLPAAVLVVLHVPSDARSELPRILRRTSRLPVDHAHARSGEDEPLAPGTIAIAPPDFHLTVRGEKVHLSRGPRVNGHRPAIDPLFRTAALALGARVIGVILSGALDDGAAGMVDIKTAGGITIVQAPEDALYAGMPRSVLELIEVHRVLPAAKIAAALVELTGRQDPEALASGMTCPECHGALWLKPSGESERYGCHVGHTYTPKGLFAAQAESIEETMLASYRAIEESASLAQRLGERARRQGLPMLAERYERRFTDAKARAEVIRGLLERGRLDADDGAADADEAPGPASPEAAAEVDESQIPPPSEGA